MEQELVEKCELELSKTMMKLMARSNNAFIVNVLLNMNKEYTDKISSIQLKGTTLQVNPEFFLGQSAEERKFDLVHSAWHLAFFDMVRAEHKSEKEIWNEACDHYNNLMIKADSTNQQITVPDWATCDHAYTGKDKEEIYQLLLDQQEDNQDDQDGGGNESSDPLANDLGGGDGDQDSDGDSDGDSESPSQPKMSPEQLQREVENIVQQAAMQAKMTGSSVPGHIEEYLEDLYNPKLPWQVILAKYMDSYAAEDYSYAKVNKSLFAHKLIMPTLFSEGLGKIAIANDESCSVTDEEFKTYLGAIQDIKEKMNPEQIDVVAFTTQITNKFIVKQDDDINKIKFRGHGGTHIPVVFDHFNLPENQPQVLIIFSDMYSDLPKKKPPYDVIWISVSNPAFKAPFGRCIHIDAPKG